MGSLTEVGALELPWTGVERNPANLSATRAFGTLDDLASGASEMLISDNLASC
jgi:hypothetical protein